MQKLTKSQRKLIRTYQKASRQEGQKYAEVHLKGIEKIHKFIDRGVRIQAERIAQNA